MVVSLALSCAPAPDGREAGSWVGEVVTEGATTSVFNRSGSVWGGTATLVEEASIGVESGADAYMFGEVVGLATMADRIAVVDGHGPAVRVFDAEGRHLRDIGGPGQGPGEFVSLSAVAIASDGRLFLRDHRARQILIYGGSGEYLDAIELPSSLFSPMPLVLTAEGLVYTSVIAEMLPDDPYRVWRLGMQPLGPDGTAGDPVLPPLAEGFTPGVISNETGSIMQSVPFYPEETWTLAPSLAVISGVPDAYRFRIDHPEGASLVVEMYWTPVAVQPDEAGWHHRRATASMRSIIPDWVWNGPRVPATKPAYRDFIPAESGETWLVRAGPGRRLPDCNEEAEAAAEFGLAPCWADETLIDVFDVSGRYLGDVRAAPGMVLATPRDPRSHRGGRGRRCGRRRQGQAFPPGSSATSREEVAPDRGGCRRPRGRRCLCAGPLSTLEAESRSGGRLAPPTTVC